MNPTPPEFTAKRHQRIGIAWLLSSLLTFITVYAGYRLYLAHKIKVKIGQIRQTGFPVTTAELNQWYAAVPPEENAALILTNAFAHLVKVNTNTPNLPIIGRGKLPRRNEPLSPEMEQAIADYVATNQVALELLEKGLALKSCRYPVDLTPGWDALLPHLVVLKNSAQLLALKTLSEIENGETAQAAESLQTMLTLADTVAKEPLLISHLVWMRCYHMSYPCLERILCMPLPEDSLQRLSSMYQTMDTFEDLQRAFVAERCVAFGSFAGSIQQIERLLESDTSDFGVTFGLWIIRVSGRWELDELYYLNGMDGYLQAIKLDLPERMDAADEVSDQIQEMKRRRYPHILSGLFLPALGKAINKDAGNIAHLRVAQTALAIEHYRLDNDRQCPETLLKLVPDFLNAVPVDPFDGRPLRYMKAGKGYVVYSVGSDREDDGGKEKQPGDKSDSRYDFTFTVNR